MHEKTHIEKTVEREPTILHRSDWASHDQLWKGAVEGKDMGTGVTVLFYCPNSMDRARSEPDLAGTFIPTTRCSLSAAGMHCSPSATKRSKRKRATSCSARQTSRTNTTTSAPARSRQPKFTSPKAGFKPILMILSFQVTERAELFGRAYCVRMELLSDVTLHSYFQ